MEYMMSFKPCTKSKTEQFNKQDILIKDMSYATIISTVTVHALIDTIITLDKNIIDYIMKYWIIVRCN
jgi:hypothetical protein